MRTVSVVLACSLIPATAMAANGDPPTSVIGGTNAAAGQWPDVAAVLFPDNTGVDYAGCSGTLVAPTIVLTAGHCYVASEPPLPDNVWIGTSSLADSTQGELIAIKAGFPYPNAQATEDITVLVLAQPSSLAPRAIATGWAQFDIVNGATVSLVGFGATDENAKMYINDLQQATTTITDATCATSPGCNAPDKPAGELGAGGMGVDTCPGDSGGPLYLGTSYGTFLAGVTSRSYAGALFDCGGGGIYERPDKVIDWIETTAGVPITRGPEPTAAPIVAVHGDGNDTTITVNDPKSSSHRFAITTQPAHGTAGVRSDGSVRVCTDASAAAGNDAVTVTVTDTEHTRRALPVTIAIQIQDGTAPAMTCSLGDFASSGGCDVTGNAGGHPGGAIPLSIGVLALLLRRRR